jgi:hypothetical protein
LSSTFSPLSSVLPNGTEYIWAIATAYMWIHHDLSATSTQVHQNVYMRALDISLASVLIESHTATNLQKKKIVS